MNILVLVAGTNEPSNCAYLKDAFVKGMQKQGDVSINTKLLKDLNIEHFNLDFYEPACHQEEDFCAIQDLVQSAHGLVIATPIWNFGVPAHLKNLLDRMGSFALDETRSKGTLGGLPFYMIFTGSAPVPAWKGIMEKTSSFISEGLQYFGASYIGHHFEPSCTVGRGEFGLVVDQRDDSIAAITEKGTAFAKVVAEFERTGKAPIAKRVRSTIMQFGEKLLKKFT